MSEQRTKIHCNHCGQHTWHALKAEDTHSGTDTFFPVDGEGPGLEVQVEDGFEVWRCLGCESGVFREWWSVDGEYPEEKFYPPRTLGRIRPKKFRKLGPKLNPIYREVVDAFNAGSPILCAGGLRALLEGICNERGIGGSSLQDKIDGLNQFVPANIAKNLHGFRFLGNQALHQLDIPDREDLGLAIEIVEDVMNVVYELDYKSGRLMQRLQERKQDKADAVSST
jgi:hypothetical protein